MEVVNFNAPVYGMDDFEDRVSAFIESRRAVKVEFGACHDSLHSMQAPGFGRGREAWLLNGACSSCYALTDLAKPKTLERCLRHSDWRVGLVDHRTFSVVMDTQDHGLHEDCTSAIVHMLSRLL